jgi:hypothetical protein
MKETYIIVAGVSVIVVVWICYELVKSAVQKANRGVEYHLEKQNRLLTKLLEKQGATYDELYKIYTDSDEEFWQNISPSNSNHKPKLRTRSNNTEQQEELQNVQ